MDKLDLDIQNYSIKEMEQLLKIPPGTKYDENVLNLKESVFRDQLMRANIPPETKTKVAWFIGEIKSTLMKIIDSRKQETPSTYETTYDAPPLKKEMLHTTAERYGTKFLQEKTMTENVQYTWSDNIYPGIINPLKRRTVYRTINIDTRFRSNPEKTSSTDFQVTLPTIIQNVVSMRVGSLEIPISFYGICNEYGNNFFKISITTPPTPPADPEGPPETFSAMIVFPDGNYNGSDYVGQLNAIFMSMPAPFATVRVDLDVSETGSGTGLLSIYSTDTTILNMTIDFTTDIYGEPSNLPLTTKFGRTMGFYHGYYDGSTSYVGDTIIEPSPIRYICLVVDDFNSPAYDQFVSVFNQSVVTKNVLVRIPVKAAFFSLLYINDFQTMGESREYFGPVNVEKLKIQLLDDHGRILKGNNGIDFSFTIIMKCLYDL